jgi:uncharacterized protein (DUF2062 family)
MPKRIFKRYMPDHKTIKEHKHLQFLGTLLHDPNLLHLNRRSVSGAFAVGLFMAFVPIPLQMVAAAIGAIIARVNLPISVGLVWITNPLTMPPLYYFCYLVGTWILGTPARNVEFQFSAEWFSEELQIIWQPFLLGCFTVSTVSAILGYVSVRAFWRLHVISSWKRRHEKRLAQKTPNGKA